MVDHSPFHHPWRLSRRGYRGSFITHWLFVNGIIVFAISGTIKATAAGFSFSTYNVPSYFLLKHAFSRRHKHISFGDAPVLPMNFASKIAWSWSWSWPPNCPRWLLLGGDGSLSKLNFSKPLSILFKLETCRKSCSLWSVCLSTPWRFESHYSRVMPFALQSPSTHGVEVLMVTPWKS